MATNVDPRFARGSLNGNASVPRLSNPQIRGSVRRSDPDGSHAQPFWSGLNGTSLVVEVGTIDGGILATVTINFTSNFYSNTVTTVNAASPTHLKWLESDGFPCIQDLHSGAKNYIKITGGTAAPIFGMPVFPSPGGMSRAGDLQPAPGDKTQANPQTTELLTHDENLSTAAVNRAIVGSLQGVDQILSALDREVACWRTIEFTEDSFSGMLAPTNVNSDPTIANLRVHTGAIAQAIADGYSYADIIEIQNSSRQTYYVTNLGTTSKVVPLGVSYGGNGFAPISGPITWGSTGSGIRPDTTAAAQSLKQASTAITSIQGSTLIASGATFQTNRIQPGDHILISGANNNSPLNHNGEFVVINVASETEIEVRPLGYTESKIDPANDAPPALNQSINPGEVYGNISVYIGWGFPLGGKTATTADSFRIWIGLGVLTGGTNAWVRLPIATTLREVISNGFLENPNSSHDPQIAFKNLANEFTQRNQFDAGITLPTLPLNGGFALASRVLAPVTGNDDPFFVLMIETDGVDLFGANYPMRVYFNRTTGGITITTNSKHNRSTDVWTKDVNGTAASRMDMNPAGIKYFQQTASDNSLITSDAWPEIPFIISAASLSSTTGGATPRFELPPTNEGSGAIRLSLLFESNTVGSVGKTRLYVNAQATAYVFTTNAVWDWTSQTWSKDSGSARSTKFTIGVAAGLSGFECRGRSTAGGTWNDSSWDEIALSQFDANIGYTIKGIVSLISVGTPNTPLLFFDGINDQLLSKVNDNVGGSIRVYNRSSSGIVISANCSWSTGGGGVWTADTPGNGGSAIKLIGSQVQFFYNTGGTTWNDSLVGGGWTGYNFLINPTGLDLPHSLVNLGLSLTGASGARTARISGPTYGAGEGSSLLVTLLEEWDPAVGGAKSRIYSGDTNLERRHVINARWDGTNWNQDNAALASYFYQFGSTERVGFKAAGSSPWTEANWSIVDSRDLSTGNQLVKSLKSDLTPLFRAQNAGGKNRFALGAHGYPTGYTFDIAEYWDPVLVKRWLSTGAYPRVSPTSGNLTTAGQPSTSWLQVAGTPLAMLNNGWGWGWNSYLDLIIPFHIMMTDQVNGHFEMIMDDNTGGGKIILGYNSGSIGGTGWQVFSSRDVSHNNIASFGSALTNSAWTKVQFEYHGSATAIGTANGAATIRVYIGGSLAVEIINNPGAFIYMPDNDNVVNEILINLSRSSGTGNINLGPMRFSYNYLDDSING